MLDYMTAQEAAEKWNVSLRWVQRLCKANRIKGVLNPRRVHSPMLASQQTNDERSESRADTPQLAAGSFIINRIWLIPQNAKKPIDRRTHDGKENKNG
jgi:hypothetical protein